VVSKESHDPRRRVGSILVSPTGEVLARGANRPPAALQLSREDSHKAIATDPAWKYFVLEHAERNAINAARDKKISLNGATMYSSLFPCADCARAIVAAGVRRFVSPNVSGETENNEKWLTHFTYARLIFGLARVTVNLAGEAAQTNQRSSR
jgi:dCMP deaminase